MSQCTRCGSQNTFIDENVKCLLTEEYRVNKLGSPKRTDIIGENNWHIFLCQDCSMQGLEKYLRSGRLGSLLIGPIILGMSIIAGYSFLILLPFTIVIFGILTPVLFFGFGFTALTGLALIPIGIFLFYKSNTKLKKLLKFGKEYNFDEEDRQYVISDEGKSIIESLKRKKQDFHGTFSLPFGKAKNPGKDMSFLDYVIKIEIPNK